MHLMYTIGSDGKRVYTLQKTTAGGEITKSAHPARFSPDDKYSRQRVTLKKRFNLLPTQQGEYESTDVATRLRSCPWSWYHVFVLWDDARRVRRVHFHWRHLIGICLWQHKRYRSVACDLYGSQWRRCGVDGFQTSWTFGVELDSLLASVSSLPGVFRVLKSHLGLSLEGLQVCVFRVWGICTPQNLWTRLRPADETDHSEP